MFKKILPLIDVKARKDGPGGFEGYGSIFNNIDSYGDIVVRGAFTETLDQFIKNGFASVGHHWSDLPIATFSSAYEDEKGLYVIADYHSDDFSQRTRTIVTERIDREKGVGLSIGFDIKPGGAVFGTDENGFPAGVRILKNLELFEVAVVNVPANPATWVSATKGREFCDDAKCGCRISATTHHQGLKFADHGEALLAELRGYTERARALTSKRADQQRTVSSEQQERITALAEELRACMVALEGVLAVPDAQPVVKANLIARAEIARFEILRAQSLIGA